VLRRRIATDSTVRDAVDPARLPQDERLAGNPLLATRLWFVRCRRVRFPSQQTAVMVDRPRCPSRKLLDRSLLAD
jgi:hypothetical protein